MKKMKLLMSLSSATVVLTAISMVATSCSNNKLEQPKEIPESKPDEGAPVAKTPETKPSESSDPEEKETPVDTKTPEEVKNPTGGEGEDNPKDDDNKGLTDQQKPANEQPTPSDIAAEKHNLTIQADHAQVFVDGKEIKNWPLELNEGKTISISVVPADCYDFVGWDGEDDVTTTTRTFEMGDTDKILTANIKEVEKFNVSILTTEGGIVDLTIDGTKTPVDVANPYNSPDYKWSHVSIEAKPDKANGYVFDHWNDDLNDKDPTKQIVLSKDINLVAHFTKSTHKVVINTTEDGAVAVSDINDVVQWITTDKENIEKAVDYGTTIKIWATPKPGYVFGYWNNDKEDTDPKKEFNPLTEDVNLTAHFIEEPKGSENNNNTPAESKDNETSGSQTHTLNLVKPEHGWYEIDGNKITDDLVKTFGTSITVKAIPKSNYVFSQWSDGNTDNPRTISDDKYLNVIFIEDLNGSVNNNTPVESENNDIQKCTLKINSRPENGSIFINNVKITTFPYEDEFDKNTEVAIKAVPDEHCLFINWNNNPKLAVWKTKITLTDNMELVANFEKKKEYKIKLKCNDGGHLELISENGPATIWPGEEHTSTIYYDESITICAFPEANYKLSQWNDEPAEDSTTSKIIAVSGNIDLTVCFTPTDQNTIVNKPTEETTSSNFELSIPKAENGHVVVNDDFITAIPNCIPFSNGIKVKAIPYNRCYKFDRWSDGETENPRIINESATIYPVFANEYPTLSIPQTKNVHYKINKINTTGPYTTNFKRGESITIEACTNDEYKFKQWSDGNTENPRTISMYDNWTLFAITNKNTEYKSIEWEEQQKDRILDAKYFTTVSKRVNGDSKFDVNEYAIFYRLAENTAFTQYNDPIDGKSYDVMCISGCSNNYLHIGSTDQDPNTAALNFTTCQELIDDIYKNKFDEIDSRYRDKEKYGYERLGFVWAKNKHNKWEPHVVKEILDDSFNNKIWYNPIHCSVIIPWTVDYIGEKAFDDASTSTGKKLHVVYANRYGIDSNGNSFWEGIKKDDMDWTCDDDWDDKTTITYNAKENKWIYPTILSRHGEHEMAAIINKMLEK